MPDKELIFLVSFIAAFLASFFFIGGTITGLVTQTMYCEEGECKEFCRFDSDCIGNEVCCNRYGSGVCEASGKCEQLFILDLDKDFEPVDTVPDYDKIAQTNSLGVMLFTFIGLLVVLLGYVYYNKEDLAKEAKPRKGSKKPKKKK